MRRRNGTGGSAALRVSCVSSLCDEAVDWLPRKAIEPRDTAEDDEDEADPEAVAAATEDEEEEMTGVRGDSEPP